MRININNTEKLEESLLAVNGKAQSLTLDECSVKSLVKEAESRLESLRLPKKDRAGVVATLTSEGPSASSYKYAGIGTRCNVVRGSKDWFLTTVERIDVYPRQTGGVSLQLTQGQVDACITALLRENNVAVTTDE